MGKLDGKVAIVTGAGSVGEGYGTGKAIAVLFAREGAKVVLVDIDEGRVAETAKIIADEGGESSTVIADLSDPNSAERVVDDAVAAFGTVDILVNNAAIAKTVALVDTSRELLESMVAVNLVAPFLLCQAAVPVMRDAGNGGAILFISSVAAYRGHGGGNAAYAATKSSHMGMTVDFADSYGKDGIRVNTIAPGMIRTPHRAELFKQTGFDESKINLGEKTMLGREGDSWDIARAALFLCGPDGSYVTGLLVPVDGGTLSRSH